MKKFFRGIYKFVANWNEILTLPIAFVLWYFSGDLLRLVDPTAATYDYGIFQITLFAIIQFLILHAVAWIVFKWTWPKMYGFLDDTLENVVLGNGAISMWEKTKLVLWIFTLYLGSLIALTRVIS